MRKTFFLLCLCFLLCCCKDKGVSFGTVEYYPSFLWIGENTSPIVKTLNCDFSIDAQNDKNSFAEFQFVDNSGKPIATSIMQVKVNGKEAKQNTFRVFSNSKVVHLVFTFSPNAESGKYQGFLKLTNHNLDRIDSQQLTAGQKVDLFQWTLNYKKRTNPLKLVFLIIGMTTILCLALWFLLLKSIFFPKIKVSRFFINGINVGYTETKKINRCRKVVFTSKKRKQGFLNKLFLGKIKYVENSVWTSDWELYPGKRRKTVKLMLHGNYSVSPMITYMASMDECTIINKDNTQIKLTIN